MIARLRGILAIKEPDQVVVDVNGVGYQVIVPLTSLAQLPEVDHEVTLVIHTHVSDSAFQLYGFLTEREKELFGLLLTVSGIGPKLAVTVLSGMDAATLAGALAAEDVKRITATPGVGKKTAQRMIVELKDKAAKLGLSGLGQTPSPTAVISPGPAADAVSALLNLGYPATQAEAAVAQAAESLGAEAALEELIREALKQMAR